MKKNFTAYDLRNVVKLGVYPVRIYELLKQYQTIGHRTLKIDEMKAMLEVQDRYKNFSDFYRWVIKPSIKQINEYTDLIVTKHTKIKEGRKYTAIKFEFKSKKAAYLGIDKSGVEEAVIELNNTAFDRLYPKVKQWIGVETFKKLLSKYPSGQIEKAISITQNRLDKGDRIDNIGGHIISLSKHQDLVDSSAMKKKAISDKKKKEANIAAQLEELQKTKKNLAREWSNKELAIIEMIFIDYPEMREVIFEKAKQRFSNYQSDKSEAENLQNPMFAATFRNIAKKQFPDNFLSLTASYEQQLKKINSLINDLS